MSISPDSIVFWEYGIFSLNGTIVFTWIVMALLSFGSWLITRRFKPDGDVSLLQSMLEAIVGSIRQQLKEVTPYQPKGIMDFLGTLFLFIAVSNILSVIPGFQPPTGSLSTTAALALLVFIAVPVYGISRAGFFNYLSNYLRPSFFMLPFNIMGEISRTLALAVRLFGNVMSSNMIGAILLLITPLFFPVIMQLLGLLTGVVQAYIFAILAAVYIGAAMEIQSIPKKIKKGEKI
ncbi:MAG: F0F1 ATP synthase subunit A [Proteobacteria bacterium]|nr:F0F1 ATP synthase subunit A [Pseudomonadota bacterium]